MRAPEAATFTRGRSTAVCLLLAALCACATSPRDRKSAEGLEPTATNARPAPLQPAWPPVYRATQRAIITVGRKQYVCDGVLTRSADGTLELALVSTLGLLTEVRVRPDGVAEVRRTTPLFREAWSRDYVARDLRWLFGQPPGPDAFNAQSARGQTTDAAVTARHLGTPDTGRWEGVELWQHGRRIYQARVTRHRRFGAWPQEVPAEIQVEAARYSLHLRTVELTIPAGAEPRPQVEANPP